MSETTAPETTTPATAADAAVWAKLAAPFDVSWIEKLPKPLRRDDRDKARCEEGTGASADGHYCGGWHARSVHLDYIGHAGITMRLNDVVGPGGWDLEPIATTEEGLPLMARGEFWAKLTVLGVSKVDLAANFNSTQEAWGDALRRTAMRFGIGTYLWAKSEFAHELAAFREPAPGEVPPEPDERAQRVAEQINAGELTDLDQALTLARTAVPPYDGALITLGEASGTLAAYIEHARPHVEAQRKAAAAATSPAPEPPQEPQNGAEETPAPVPGPEEPPAAPHGPQNGAQAPAEDALELARAALEERDVEALKELWRMGNRAGILNTNVIAVIGDDDLAAIDQQNAVTMPLGALLQAANSYVGRHGAAIRDLGEPAAAAQ